MTYSRDIFRVEGQIEELFIAMVYLYVFTTHNMVNIVINFTF